MPGLSERAPLSRTGGASPELTVANDPHALGILKHYRSLMPMAQTARKPIFRLTAADGAIGAHWAAVQQVGKDFRDLSAAISQRVSVAN
jgi:hypothetical protein